MTLIKCNKIITLVIDANVSSSLDSVDAKTLIASNHGKFSDIYRENASVYQKFIVSLNDHAEKADYLKMTLLNDNHEL